MARALAPLYSCNVGEVSKLALARLDLQRMRVAGERVENWLPSVLGPMMFRPGLESVGSIVGASGAVPAGFQESDCSDVAFIEFAASLTDTAIVELTPGAMRVWGGGVTLLERPTALASVTNGTFASLSGWTVTTTGGASATATASGVELAAPGKGGRVRLAQVVTTFSPGAEHALRIVIGRGPVRFSVGTFAGGDDLLAETPLAQGVHSLAFRVPDGFSFFHIQFESDALAARNVLSCQIEPGGPVSIPTPFDRVALRRLTHVQSIDVVFVASGRMSPRRIERRGSRSWSLVEYFADKGPLITAPTARVKLTPGTNIGITTLTSSGPLFKPEHVGAIFRLYHTGQVADLTLAGNGEFTPPLRISGVGTDRSYSFTVSGTWSGFVSVQRSFDGPDSGFSDVTSYATNTSGSTIEANDNAIVWIRFGFKEGNYASGQASIALRNSNGGGEGFCRVISYISPTQVLVEVLSRFYNVTPTDNWQEGRWSALRGYPSAVTIADGRLFWGTADQYAGSVSDAYDNLDLAVDGEAGPIIRSIATGPSHNVQWMLSLQRLIIGTSGAEVSVRSSAFDSPLTPTDNTARNASTYGAASIPAVAVDRAGVFVAKDQTSAIEVAYSVDAQDYASKDLTELNPDLLSPGVIDMAVQRHPDTRIWFVLSDGTARCLTYERDNEVVAWSRITTPGQIKAVCVLPAPQQDRVFFAVQRASGMRIERMAMDSEARGGAISANVDAFIRYQGPAVSAVPFLSHLEGQPVHVFAHGRAYGPITVTGGVAPLPAGVTVTSAVAGLYYEGLFRSVKLGFAARQAALGQRKRIDGLALAVCDTHHDALLIGSDVAYLDPLPRLINEELVPPDRVWDQEDFELTPINGSWSEDERFVVKAVSPYPATVQGVVIDLSGHEAG